MGEIVAPNPEELSILQIASGDLWAGAESQIRSLTRALSAHPTVRLHAVILNHGMLADRLRQDGTSVTVLDEKSLTLLQLYSGISRAIESFQPDIVHTHRHKENILGSIASLSNGRIPSIRTVHGSEEHTTVTRRRRIVTALDKLAAKHWQRCIVAVSRTLQHELHQQLGRAVEFIPNGVDDRLFEMRREAHQRHERPFNIAFAARIVPVKRIDLFVDIARSLLAGADQSIEFHVFGEGPELENARTLTRKLQIDGSVHLHGFEADLPSRLADMDCLVITSDHEGLPMVVLEAASIGLPIVARAVGEIPAVLDHGRGGELVESAEAEAFVDILRRQLDQPAAAESKAAHARQHVLRHYSAAACARRYVAVYESLAGG